VATHSLYFTDKRQEFLVSLYFPGRPLHFPLRGVDNRRDAAHMRQKPYWLNHWSFARLRTLLGPF